MLVLIAAAALLGLLFTAFAYFGDTEASIGNTFQAATWSVEGGGNHTFRNLNAGDTGTETWTATNTGSVSAYVGVNISVTESGTGNLSQFLIGHLYASSGDDICGDAPVSDIAGGYDQNLSLEPGESVDIILDWYVSDDYDSYDENDEARVKISFDIHPAP